MQDFRAIVQDSWAKAVLAVSAVEDHAQAMVGEAKTLVAELTPEGAQKLAADVSSALREHRRQLVEQVEGAVRRGPGPAEATGPGRPGRDGEQARRARGEALGAHAGEAARMTGQRKKTWFILAACVGAIAAGGAAELLLLPRHLPKPSTTLKDQPSTSLTQPQLDALLARVARPLDPALRTRLAEAVLSESARNGYDPLFIRALVAVESRFRVSVSSERGASGLMQLKPSTFAWISAREPDLDGADAAVADDPVLDVRLAVRYFRWLEHRFHSRNDALMAYNAGPHRLAMYRRSAEDVPDRLREYPRRVMKEYRRFVRMTAGYADPQNLLLARAN